MTKFIGKRLGNKIAEQAITWINTPHRNGQISKGKQGGIDCALLPFACVRDIGLINGEPEDFGIDRQYSPDWYLFRRGNDMIKSIEIFCTRVTNGKYQNGDLITYQYGRAISHTAIIVDIDKGLAVHADARVGEVQYLNIDDIVMSKRQRDIYRLDMDKVNSFNTKE